VHVGRGHFLETRASGRVRLDGDRVHVRAFLRGGYFTAIASLMRMLMP
jgi:hypothetical protein